MPYIPAMDDTMVRTLADWGAFYDRSGENILPIVELMSQTNDFVDDILWREATDTNGNVTVVRDGLPKVYWRRLYEGIPVSKSTVSRVIDPVGMLEARSVIDAKLLQLHQKNARAYRLSETKPFLEAMTQELATAMIYGNIKDQPLAIHGLSPRYTYKDAPHVIDAGGTGNKCTSMWGVVWGETEVYGIFPKDSPAGLRHKDLGETDASDTNGNVFRAVSDLYEWNVGLAVSDWRCVVRICNIDTTKLFLKEGEAGFIDFQKFTTIAKNLIPASKIGRLKWYVNRDVQTALEFQDNKAGGVTLYKGQPFDSKPVSFLHGAPLRRSDAILSTEEALVVTP